MSDPISITGTAVGLLSLGIQVTQSLVNFYQSYKSQDSTLTGTIERLECLSDIFQSLEKTLLNRKLQAEDQSLIKSIEVSIRKCDELIYELQEECQKFHKSSNGIVAAVRVAGRRASYPFRQSTLQKLDEGIGEIQDNLSTALNVLQLKDHRSTQDSIAEVKLLLELVRTHQISSELCDWLKAPDATVNYNSACAKRYPGTGMWLMKGPLFSTWLTEQNSFLWLNGFAGSGKSVLCSTAIQFALRHRGSDPNVGIAFFYFTFNDESKRDESGMLRALLLQLSSQLPEGEADLTKLHHSYKIGIPPSLVLIEYLRRLIQRFHHVYIALDGLDESPRDGPREYVLDTLNAMRNWGVQGLHLFVTSRDEPDIRGSLNLRTEQQVTMRNVGIDRDIADSICTRLDTDQRLQKWLPHRDKIQEALTNRAKGVFRWVDCQFRSLQFCPRSEHHLDRLLDSLPQSLDETYERMLCSIDHHLVQDARRILTLLCFAARPLTVREIIDGVAVQVNNPPGLNYKCRLQDFNDLHAICPGLIDIDFDAHHANETYCKENLTLTVQIAHFSVQEYLESERIRYQKAAIFNLSSSTAHAEIAKICLVYLLEQGLSSSELDQSILEKYPLAHFAAMHWYRHYKSSMNPTPGLDEFVLRLFQNQDSFANWIKLHDVNQPWDTSIGFYRKVDGAAPVYYASLLGLDHTLNELIRTASLEDITTPALSLKSMSTSKISTRANTQDGLYDSALRAASGGGHEKAVQLLLKNGADVNAQHGDTRNALQAASLEGHEKIVRLLLDKGADVNAQNGYFGNALQATSKRGHKKVVQLLLENGADVNAQGGLYGNALQAASSGGHEEVMQLLLDKGADVNAQSGYFGNALQATSKRGHKKVVQLLLENGADVNAQSGRYGNALQAASSEGHEEVMQLLLDKGADVNAQGGYFNNALQAASSEGHENSILMLLEKGAAPINTQGGRYDNALRAASVQGHVKVVELLLAKGADANSQGGYYGSALQAASSNNHINLVQLLLDKGADVDAQGGRYGSALQAASSHNHVKVVQLLLDSGANVDAQGGYYGSALQAASSKGHEKVVRLLLETEADVNAQNGYYGNALQASSSEGFEKVVQVLLDKGADINAQGGKYDNALRAASRGGHKNIVHLLLKNGAEINPQGGNHASALQAASGEGHKEVVQLLLGKGADVNSQGGYCGNALQAASIGDHEEVVQLLLDNGADVNAQGGKYGNALEAASRGGHEQVRKLLLDKGAVFTLENPLYLTGTPKAQDSEKYGTLTIIEDEPSSTPDPQY